MTIDVLFVGFETISPEYKFNNPLSPYISLVEEVEKANVLIISSAVNFNEFNLVKNFKGIKILYLSEPIYGFDFSTYSRIIYETQMYDFIFGCVENDITNNKFKYPLYIDVLNKFNDFTHKTYNVINKNFCCLISRHDINGFRTEAFKILSKYNRVDCPGALFNNINNETFEKIGKYNFISNYIFNICFENFGNCHKGYITEKLGDCCVSGAIPIYNGTLDDIDKKIFNENRIIFVENTKDGFKKLDKTIEYYLTNTNELFQLYNQKIFNETASETLEMLKQNPKILMEAVKNKINFSN